MIEIKTQSELDVVLSKNTYVFLDFYTPSCPPCIDVAPYIEELEIQYSLVTFAKVDCTRANDITIDYGVSAVPTFILFTSGKRDTTVYGSNRDEILAAITEFFPQ